jgi:hypothetical protein
MLDPIPPDAGLHAMIMLGMVLLTLIIVAIFAFARLEVRALRRHRGIAEIFRSWRRPK